MRLLPSLAIIYVVSVSPIFGKSNRTCQLGSGAPLFSKNATLVENNNATHVIVSPDRQQRLIAQVNSIEEDPTGYRTLLKLQRGRRTVFRESLSGWGAEIAWSPDSKAFFVTETVGGGGIGYRTYVFFTQGLKVQKVEISHVIAGRYDTPKGCIGPIKPNIAAVGWLEASARLLIVAETVPVSVCKCPGAFTAYEMEFPEKVIVRELSQAEAKRQYSSLLGCLLENAPNNCKE